jgi:hypothetical protein
MEGALMYVKVKGETVVRRATWERDAWGGLTGRLQLDTPRAFKSHVLLVDAGEYEIIGRVEGKVKRKPGGTEGQRIDWDASVRAMDRAFDALRGIA